MVQARSKVGDIVEKLYCS